MKKVAIVIMCCAFALTLGLAGCGGSSSGSAASGSASGQSASASSSEDAAAKQAAEAQEALDSGIEYWYGTGDEGYDKEKARTAFQKAADLGNAEGWYWLGVVAEIDVEADRWPQVIEYYQKAADGGCAKGLYGLAGLYKTGYGVEKDAAKAKELYEQAAGAGELCGHIGLGDLYRDGEGVEASGAEAVAHYEKAAAADESATRNRARWSLGKLYAQGGEGLEADGAKAIEYYQQAADEHYANGWAGMGYTYQNGLGGIEADEAKAFECYEKQADLGSWYNLAVCYEYGHGCEVDYAKAIELFNQEVSGGKLAASAMGGLAYMATMGYGTEQDYTVAADWCHKALDAAGPGDDEAVDYANELLDWLANNS